MRTALVLAAALAAAGLSTPASAQKSYGPGVSDTEIKVGNTMPYSGPASPLSITGKVIAGYFDEVNEKGGVNGRKLNLISLDDAFSPPKTMEAARRLVESDGVAFIFDRKVPQQQQGAAVVLDQLGLEVERSGQHALVDGAALGAELHQ